MAAAAAAMDGPAAAGSGCAADEEALKVSLFHAALERIPHVRDGQGRILTDPFLDLCQLVLPLIDSFGAAFMIVRNDISNNIERLRARKRADPAQFERLFPLVEEEVARNDDNHSQSCTKGLLWLKRPLSPPPPRAMEFMLAILRRLLEAPEATMSEAVYDMYYKTLHKWHGFFASSAFSVAFAFVPGRDTFLDRLAGGKFTVQTSAEMAKFVDAFGALLAEVHTFLDERGLDDPVKV